MTIRCSHACMRLQLFQRLTKVVFLTREDETISIWIFSVPVCVGLHDLRNSLKCT